MDRYAPRQRPQFGMIGRSCCLRAAQRSASAVQTAGDYVMYQMRARPISLLKRCAAQTTVRDKQAVALYTCRLCARGPLDVPETGGVQIHPCRCGVQPAADGCGTAQPAWDRQAQACPPISSWPVETAAK